MNITQEGEDQYQIRQERQNIKSMSKLNQIKIPVVVEGYNWKLVRERDGLTKESTNVMWLEFDEVGRFKDKYDTPAVGRSLIMSPFSQYFTWQTTTITEIVEERDDYVKFKTENSNYELWKLS
jgi:hypothetical protein